MNFKKSLIEHKGVAFAAIGIINAIPFTFQNLFFLSWFTIAPFFVMLIKSCENVLKKSTLFRYIFTFFFFFHFGVYYFFMSLVPLDFVGLGYVPSVILMLFAWIVLSTLCSLVFSFAFNFILKLKFSHFNKIIIFSLTFVLIQYIQSLGTYGFTWSRISLPQSAALPLIQSASLLGPYFVDLILVLTNAFIAIAYLTKKVRLFGSIAITVFSLNFLFGAIYMHKGFDISDERKFSLVQGNISTEEKWSGGPSYYGYLDESLKLDVYDTIVVWGETAVPTSLNDSKMISKELKAYTKMTGNDMIVGAFYENQTGNTLNAAYYITEGNISNDLYFKRKLVPFGEFLPAEFLLKNIPFVKDMNLSSRNIFSGDSPRLIDTEDGKIGCLICFDSIFPYLARSTVKQGAEILVIMTNDSWYKDHPAVYQHNNQARWRAVENGRYVARAANSGISSFISPHGEIIASLPPLYKGSLTETLYFSSEKTLYTVVGDIIIWLIVGVLLVYIAFYIKKTISGSDNR
ncbi:MAG: apolipoprotein N-acyltransferase [Ruminococcaceae bacterium]|nr:apolipoprotein N-acyltransferase [Oscillospiraceae bacterium]